MTPCTLPVIPKGCPRLWAFPDHTQRNPHTTNELSTTKNMTYLYHIRRAPTCHLQPPLPLMHQRTPVVHSSDIALMITITTQLMELRRPCSTAPTLSTPSCSTILSSPLESHSRSRLHHHLLALVMSRLLFSLGPCVSLRMLYRTGLRLPEYPP